MLVLPLGNHLYQENKNLQKTMEDLNLETIYFGAGCFWCVEAIYESVYGVEEVISGYAGGTTVNPNYQQIGTGRTGHAETVEVYYDPKKVDFKTLLAVFFDSHDPTTKNLIYENYNLLPLFIYDDLSFFILLSNRTTKDHEQCISC